MDVSRESDNLGKTGFENVESCGYRSVDVPTGYGEWATHGGTVEDSSCCTTS